MCRLVVVLLLFYAPFLVAQPNLLKEYLTVQQQQLHFNGVVLVTKKNEPVYKMAVGMASEELSVPMKPEAVFKVASISKQFTAMLVNKAVEEGRLNLEDSLASFFPQLKEPDWRRIRVRQLLEHRSGIPHNEGIRDYWTSLSRQSLSRQQAVTAILSMKLLFQPGSDSSYSSPAYYLLADILEQQYKQPYADLLKEKLLQPRAMQHTGVFTNEQFIKGMTTSYHVVMDRVQAAPYRDFSLMKGSGDLYSTAEDMARWNHSFASNPAKLPPAAFGWQVRKEKRLVWYHGGGSFGVSALSAWYPEEEVSIVLLSNVSVLPVKEIWSDIEKIVFKEPFEMPKNKQPIVLTADMQKQFTGTYKLDPQVLSIFQVGDQLYLKKDDRPPFEIFPESPTVFYGKKVPLRINFKFDEKKQVQLAEVELKGSIYLFVKYQP